MRFLFISLLLSSIALNAQKASGLAYYQSSTSMDVTLDSTKFSSEMQSQMKAMLAQALQKEYSLSFNKSESLFKEVEKLNKGAGMNLGMFSSMISGVSGMLYKNTSTGQVLDQVEFFGKMFLIKDTLEKPEWKLGKESKQIGKYTCYKATRTDQQVKTTFDEDGKESSDTLEVEIVAWYTPMVPVSTGPEEYWGLPGLIMEVKSGNTMLLCSRLEMNPEDAGEITAPEKGEEVTRAEFREIAKKKMEEMKEMYGGEGRGRGSSITIQR